MTKAAGIIQAEHGRHAAILQCLDNLARDIDVKGRAPDFVLAHLIVTYIREFLDCFHHPKEDAYLFKALCKRCPEIIPTLDALAVEHETGPLLLDAVERALEDYEMKGSIAYLPFRDAVRSYVAFERAHVMREETEVLPRARELLTKGDWDVIDAVFTANEDPIFGAVVQERFRRLFTAIVELAPTTYVQSPAV